MIRIYFIQHRDELMFDKDVEYIDIDIPRIDLTRDVIIHNHDKKNAEVTTILKEHGIWNNVIFWAPSMRSCSGARIDTGFI